MTSYSIVFARSARKELELLDATMIQRIFPKIEALSKEPRPKDCRKLQGRDNLWRIRVGDYRVLYNVDNSNQTVDIVAVKHRSKAYEGF